MKKTIGVLITIIIVIIVYFPLKRKIPESAEKNLNILKDSMRSDAVHKLDKMFGQSHFGIMMCVLFHDFVPKYELIANNKLKDDEIYKRYYVTPENISNSLKNIARSLRLENGELGRDIYMPIVGYNWRGAPWQFGWSLGCITRISEDSYICYNIVPYMIGYKKQTDRFMLDLEPSVEDALSQAFDFYSKNDKSPFANFFQESNLKLFLDDQNVNISNSFYFLEQIKPDADLISGCDLTHDGKDYMYNNFVKVYVSIEYATKYTLSPIPGADKEYKTNYIESETNKLNKRFVICETLLLALLTFFITETVIKNRKQNKTYLQRIVSLSNPRRYLKNYDQNNINVANVIYNKAINTDKEDEQAIYELCVETEEKLKIKLITNIEIKELTKKCNPKLFMKPYDVEKVNKANSIFAILKQEKIDYSIFIKLKREVESLYEDSK